MTTTKFNETAPWHEWVMDVTNWPRYCFVPYERETESLVLGMSLIQDRAPGTLAGIYHSDGDDCATTWARNNPKWRERYAPND